MTLAKIVAQNISAARMRRKLSQQAVADKAALSVSYISMLERGLRSPPLETLEVLAKALSVPPMSLLQEDRTSSGGRRTGPKRKSV